MRSLLAPSGQARKVLADAGLSIEQLREAASGPGGLVEALDILNTGVGGSSAELSKFFGRAEATNAALAILGATSEDIESTFGEVANSTGVLGDAFDAAASTDSFKLQQAMTEIKVALISFGTEVAPVVADGFSKIGGAISGAADIYGKLPGPVKSGTTALLGMTAAAAPVALGLSKAAKFVGNFTDSVDASGKATTGYISKLKNINPTMLGIGAAIGIAAIALKTWNDRKREARERADTYTEAIVEASGINTDFSEILERATAQLDAQAEALDGTTKALGDATPEGIAFAAVIEEIGGDGAEIVSRINELGVSMEDLSDIMSGSATTEQIEEFNSALDAMDIDNDATFEFGKALSQAGQAAEDSAAQLDERAEAALRLAVEDGLLTQEQVDLAISNETVAGTMAATSVAAEKLFGNLEQNLDLVDGLSQSTLDWEISQIEAGSATQDLTDDVASFNLTAEDAMELFDDMSESLEIQSDSFDGARRAARQYQGVLDGMHGAQQGPRQRRARHLGRVQRSRRIRRGSRR